MKTVSSILNQEWYERYQKISKLSLNSSLYDITNSCNLRCKSCFFYSNKSTQQLDENDIKKWDQFIFKEKERGINFAILIGGEPTLYLDRVMAFYRQMNTFCTTNGQIKIPRDIFPKLKIGISLWGDEKDEIALRGKNTFPISAENYNNDPNAYFIYILTPLQCGKINSIVNKINKVGLKVHFELLSNDENIEELRWTEDKLQKLRVEMDEALDNFTGCVISTKYYHKIITSREMMGRKWGWEECPSISLPFDTRQNRPKRLNNLIRWGSDLQHIYRCCSSDFRQCEDCYDSAAQTSWILVNKRLHLETTESLQNWIETCEMFSQLY
jgi:MoaA/NifB/PqqE/SkfB family radical SAM enzyme